MSDAFQFEISFFNTLRTLYRVDDYLNLRVSACFKSTTCNVHSIIPRYRIV